MVAQQIVKSSVVICKVRVDKSAFCCYEFISSAGMEQEGGFT